MILAIQALWARFLPARTILNSEHVLPPRTILSLPHSASIFSFLPCISPLFAKKAGARIYASPSSLSGVECVAVGTDISKRILLSPSDAEIVIPAEPSSSSSSFFPIPPAWARTCRAVPFPGPIRGALPPPASGGVPNFSPPAAASDGGDGVVRAGMVGERSSAPAPSVRGIGATALLPSIPM